MKTQIVVVVLALVLGLVSYSIADEQAALGKLSAAAAAAKEKKAADVSAAIKDASDIIAKDSSDAGEVAAPIGREMSATFSNLAKSAQAKVPSDFAIESATDEVKDIYGLVIPGAKGDFAAAATYVRSLIAKAPEEVKGKLEDAAKGLDDAAAGKGDKAKAFGKARAVVLSTIDIYRADALVKAGKGDDAAVLLNRVGTYLNAEANIASKAGRTSDHDALGEYSSLAKSTAVDLARGVPEGTMKGEDEGIEYAVAGAAAPAETAPKAAEAPKMSEEQKAQKKELKPAKGEK